MSEGSRLIQRTRDIISDEGIDQMLQKGFDKIKVYSQYPFKKAHYENKSFSCGSQELPYAIYTYNATWRNERIIEVPVLQSFLDKHKGERILEIGNVSHDYIPFLKRG